MADYEVIILGGGPAGLTAGLYAARSGLKTLLLEGNLPGGQASTTNELENYPGCGRIGGPELMMKFEEQAKEAGLDIQYQGVIQAYLKEHALETRSQRYQAQALILATGAARRKLGAAGEDMLVGRGVSYCATCDGALYRGKPVAVVGGGNTAAEDALYLAGIGCPVTLIHRRDALRADQALSRRVLNHPLVTMAWNSVVERIQQTGDGLQLHLRQVKTDQSSVIQAAGCFVAVGTQPQTGLFAGQVDMDPEGYIAAGEDTHTSLPGVFAAGDLRRKPLRQVITAAADGAVAASQALQYIRGL